MELVSNMISTMTRINDHISCNLGIICNKTLHIGRGYEIESALPVWSALWHYNTSSRPPEIFAEKYFFFNSLVINKPLITKFRRLVGGGQCVSART